MRNLPTTLPVAALRTGLAVGKITLPAMSVSAVAQVRRLEDRAARQPQVAIDTRHVLHAGVYTRTVRVPAGVRITGALVKIPTQLVVSGDVDVFTGTEVQRITGYAVLSASPGRKQVFVSHTDTYLTMIFATDAKTVAEAEAEFTEEADRLASRRADTPNLTLITGE